MTTTTISAVSGSSAESSLVSSASRSRTTQRVLQEAQFRRLVENARELWLRALITTAYGFGFRKSELLTLRVDQLDLIHRTIRLNPGETKNDEARTIKMTTEVFLLLAALIEGKRDLDLVFTRSDGSAIEDFRGTWFDLCVTSGLGRQRARSRRGCPAHRVWA